MSGAAPPELTLRALALGAIVTIVFTAANVYLGLKVGLTVASSIPSAVISMAALRAAGGGSILENNIVQTLGSAAGALSSIIFVVPALIIVGHWQGFPFWQTTAICVAGGVLGVLFSIPLRRAMVVQTDLPYPEGVAAAEILKVGDSGGGAVDILAGSVVAALVNLATGGLHLLADGASWWLRTANGAVFRFGTGFSLALLGAGYLIGLAGGLAILLGAVIAWIFAVPLLTASSPAPDADFAAHALTLWASKVRFIGAGIIGIAAIRALAGLARPTWQGLVSAVSQSGVSGGDRTDRDFRPRTTLAIFACCCLCLAWSLGDFLGGVPPLGLSPAVLIAACLVFAVLFGFLVAAACGYMAGLVGSSSSPISGIAILATIGSSLLIIALAPGALRDPVARQGAIALVLFTVSIVLATATVSNDNLQDLKTGFLVGATPAKQQASLVVGCIAGGLVIPPVLDLLYRAYGFAGAMPRAGMNPAAALAAPQANLMARLATGILGGTLEWKFILAGAAICAVLIGVDALLKRYAKTAHLPVLAVGLGVYLPPTVGVTLALGAILGAVINARLGAGASAEASKRRGVLLASGLIVGESLVGVALAAVIVSSGGRDAPLALVGDDFALAPWLGLAMFLAVAAWFARRVTRPA